MFGKDKIERVSLYGADDSLIITIEKKFKIVEKPSRTVFIKQVIPESVEVGSTVKVVLHTKKRENKTFSGQIISAGKASFTVQLENELSPEEERRRFVKVKTAAEGIITFVTRDEKLMKFDKPLPIEIKDINIGGLFIQSDIEFRRGDIIMLEAFLGDSSLKSSAEVLRAQPCEENKDVCGYGCRFIQLNPSEEEMITRYIYRAQVIERRRKAKSET